MQSRSFAILAAVTAIAVLAAVWAVVDRQRSTQVAQVPEALFPGLIDRVNEVEEVRVAAPGLSFSIVKDDEGNWTVPDRGGYPVTFETVKQSVVGIAGLRPLEAKTARPELHEKLDLVAPDEGGKGRLVALNQAGGDTLAAVLVGRTKTPPSSSDPGRHYVRKADEDQTWLAEGRMEVWDRIERWLDPAMPTIERKRVYAVETRKPDGEEIRISKDDPDGRDFKVDDLPEGWRLLHDTAANPLGSALGFLSFEDVKPVDQVDFAEATRAEFLTFDGLVLYVDVVQDGELYWGRFAARARPEARSRLEQLTEEQRGAMKDAAAVDEEVAEINRRFGPWAYRLPGYKGKDFLTPREAIVVKDDKATDKNG